jgi:predicted nucleic acid-binding protein
VKYLVDANVLSEMTRKAPQPRVLAWLRRHETELAVSPVVLGEIEFGILLLPAGRRRTRLQHWFAEGIQRMRTLDLDRHAASAWSRLLARLRKAGHAMPVKDSLIAATALAHGLVVATHSTRDFQHAGVPVEDPFVA